MGVFLAVLSHLFNLCRSYKNILRVDSVITEEQKFHKGWKLGAQMVLHANSVKISPREKAAGFW